MSAEIRPARSYRFANALARRPGKSIADGIRMEDEPGSRSDPDAILFEQQHQQYLAAVDASGVTLSVLGPLEEFPDSVFIEDAAICVDGAAIITRPGASSRSGEGETLRPALSQLYSSVIDLAEGALDGGDVLLSDDEAFIGLSQRTNERGMYALAEVLADFGYRLRRVDTPAEILHFKSDCGLLDERTIFSTARLAATGCFEGYGVIEAPAGEEAAANLIRINDSVFINSGFPKSRELLVDAGFSVVTIDTSEAAKVDGGLSCMTLRFSA